MQWHHNNNKQFQSVTNKQKCVGRYGARCMSALMGLVTLTLIFWPWNWYARCI